MLGSERFTFETPNVIDPGDLPPSQPARKVPLSQPTPPDDSDNLYEQDRQSSERLLTDISDLQLSSDYNNSHNNNNNNKNDMMEEEDQDDLESQEARGFLASESNSSGRTRTSEEKKNSIEPAYRFKYSDRNEENSHEDTKPPGLDTNKQAFADANKQRRIRRGVALSSGVDSQHSLPAIEEARTYAASLLHSSNKTSSRVSSSQDPFAFSCTSIAAAAAVIDASTTQTRRMGSASSHQESIDRNHRSNSSKHLVRKAICGTLAQTIICALLLVMLALLVAMTIKVVRSGQDKEDSSAIKIPGSNHNDTVPTVDNEAPPMSRLELTYNFLNDYLDTDPDELTTTGSPTNMAAAWVAEMDGLALDIPTSLDSKDALSFMQRFVLATLYYSTNGPKSWRNKLGFLTEQSECGWYGDENHVPSFGSSSEVFALGVTCNDNLQIESILLPSNQLQGPLPVEIGHLTNLTMLALPHNQLDGMIPYPLAYLVKLEYLDLNFNFFQDRIPNSFAKLGSLQVLGLSNNYLEHELPASFAALTSLKTLSIDDNLLTGDFSGSINSMISLEYLYADRNQFDEQIDETFLEGLVNLKELDLSDNRFTSVSGADFPIHLLQHKTLTVLDFGGNFLRSALPQGLETNTVLKYFSLRDNNMVGYVDSTTLPLLTGLEHLDVQGNEFQGEWPLEMDDLVKLNYLFMGNNPNILPNEVPSWLYKLTGLQELSMTKMQMVNYLPEWISALTNLEFVDFSHNSLKGPLIDALFQLPSLQYLLLHNNTSLLGSVPTNITNAKNFKILTLYQTGIEDNINHVCAEAPSMELLAVDCKEFVVCDTSCCPKCCNRNFTIDTDAYCFQEAVPTYLQFFEGMWELNFTRAQRSFDPALVTNLPGNNLNQTSIPPDSSVNATSINNNTRI